MNANHAAAAKTTLTHFLACFVAAFLGAVIMRAFVFGSGGSSLFEVVARVAGRFFSNKFDFLELALPASYAFGIGVTAAYFRTQRWWHVLIWAIVVFGVVPYFLINHDVGFSMYIALAAPWFGVGALVGWIISRRFWPVLL